METILVTGGAGFIGSHVCEELLKKGYSVLCIDNFNDYYDPRCKERNLNVFGKNPLFRLFRADILNRVKLEEIFSENHIDYVIHLAARAGVRPSFEQPDLYSDVNITGTANLLELAKKYKIKKFIFGSSSSVYGKNSKVPFCELDPVDNQISPYALTKKIGELLCKFYSDTYDISIACLRFFTVYGPRGRPDMAPYLFTNQIYQGKPIYVFGDGTSKRDYTYIGDIVHGILISLEKRFEFEIINLGDSNPIELNRFISIIEMNLNKKAHIIHKEMPKGDVPLTYADISKAHKLLGYKPKIKIEEGMKKFIRWYLDNN
jgi:UDP-glucuronate 4-epimerase